ncbi:MAG: amidase [Chthoniobacteraceae bacterium]
MKRPLLAITGCALFSTLLLSGCATPLSGPRRGSKDHTYIAYWPPVDGAKTRVAVKDLIDMQGVVTTAGSQFFAKTRKPAASDAACLRGMRGGNVQIVGRTNLTELAVGVTGINDYFGTPRNPVTANGRRIPGGSSSGSAAAVANGTADIAIGTDTAGSIRVPAACCGIVGLKTTFGLVPIDGVYPISPRHLDTVGPMAKDVAHTAQGMDLLKPGFAGRYRAAVAAKPSAGMIRVGRLRVRGTSEKVDRAVDDALARTGFKVVELGGDFQKWWTQAQTDGNTIAAASAWLTNRRLLIAPGVTARTKAIITLGLVESQTRYAGALKRQAAWQGTLRVVFKNVDFIALPTLQTLPPKLPFFGLSAAFEALVLVSQNTVAVNYAGNPALAVPIPVDDEHVLVSSLQLVGPRLSEAALLNAGRLVEASGVRRE